MINSIKNINSILEEMILKEYNNKYGVMYISNKYSIKRHIISKILRKNNIKIRRQSREIIISKKIELEIIHLYLNGCSTMELCSMYMYKKHIINRILKDYNIQIRKKTPRMKFDINFFSKYNPESCYWAGFIAADGNLRKDRYNVNIHLKKDEYKHLLKLKDITNYSKDVKTDKNSCRIEFTGHWFNDDLINNFDINPQKSLIIEISNKIPIEFLDHFIRGYFDGDGCITKTSCPTISFASGSLKLLQKLIDIFYEIGIRLKTKQKKPILTEKSNIDTSKIVIINIALNNNIFFIVFPFS